MRRGSLALTAISVAAALRSFRALRELDARLTPPPVSFENGEDHAQTSDPRGRGVRAASYQGNPKMYERRYRDPSN